MRQNDLSPDRRIMYSLFFRLLPMQILLAAIGSVNGIVSSLFASNCIGEEAMNAIGLYSPVNQFLGTASLLLVGGSQILCGKHLGRNQIERTQEVFSLDLFLSASIGILVTVFVLLCPMTGILHSAYAKSEEIHALNMYCFGQAIGILPYILGQQLSAFLSLENQMRRTTIASLIFIAVNLILNGLLVWYLDLGPFGLALCSSLGYWVFFLLQARYYITGKSMMKLHFHDLLWKNSLEIVLVGLPGAVSQGCQVIRRIIVNHLIVRYSGTPGMSAFTASDTLLGIFWAVPLGIFAVSRMLISISVGEEDRQSLQDVTRTLLFRCVPLVCAVSAAIIASAPLLASLYYHDPSQQVFQMTMQGFRILPLCMPLSTICLHFVCYGQASDKRFLVYLLSVLDGVVCVAGFSALLVPVLGLKGVFVANVLNGVVTTLVIVAYSWIQKKHFPKTIEDLMVIPDDFGVPPEERMDMTIRNTEQVVAVSRSVMDFCRSKGVDEKRTFHAGLFLEEMAGNVIEHGFTKDSKPHSVDLRVSHKGEKLFLRIKDDCIPFDPAERAQIMDPEDPAKNIGIRAVYSMTDQISYQNILGLNVLTVQI